MGYSQERYEDIGEKDKFQRAGLKEGRREGGAGGKKTEWSHTCRESQRRKGTMDPLNVKTSTGKS